MHALVIGGGVAGCVSAVALRKAGLDVISDHRVLGRPTPENVSYLASKRDRAGHFIDIEGLLASSMKD